MATYNGEEHVEQQVASILTELGPDDELVVVDDASTDATVAVLQRLGHHLRVLPVSNPVDLGYPPPPSARSPRPGRARLPGPPGHPPAGGGSRYQEALRRARGRGQRGPARRPGSDHGSVRVAGLGDCTAPTPTGGHATCCAGGVEHAVPRLGDGRRCDGLELALPFPPSAVELHNAGWPWSASRPAAWCTSTTGWCSAGSTAATPRAGCARRSRCCGGDCCSCACARPPPPGHVVRSDGL